MFHFKNELCFCSFSGIIFCGKWGSTLSLSIWSDKTLRYSKINGSVIFNLSIWFFSWCLGNGDTWCGFSKVYKIFMGHLTIQMVNCSKKSKNLAYSLCCAGRQHGVGFLSIFEFWGTFTRKKTQKTMKIDAN